MATKTIVTGRVEDPSGVAVTGGYVTFRIVPGAQAQPYRVTGTSVIAPMEVQAVIDSHGDVKASDGTSVLQIWGNDWLEPANSTYQIEFAPFNQPAQIINGYLISGDVYDLASPVFQDEFSINPASTPLRGEPVQANLIPLADAVFVVGSSTNRYSAGHFISLFVDNFIPAYIDGGTP